MINGQKWKTNNNNTDKIIFWFVCVYFNDSYCLWRLNIWYRCGLTTAGIFLQVFKCVFNKNLQNLNDYSAWVSFPQRWEFFPRVKWPWWQAQSSGEDGINKSTQLLCQCLTTQTLNAFVYLTGSQAAEILIYTSHTHTHRWTHMHAFKRMHKCACTHNLSSLANVLHANEHQISILFRDLSCCVGAKARCIPTEKRHF